MRWRVRSFMAAQFGIPAFVLLATWVTGHEQLYGLGWNMYS